MEFRSWKLKGEFDIEGVTPFNYWRQESRRFDNMEEGHPQGGDFTIPMEHEALNNQNSEVCVWNSTLDFALDF